MRDEFGSECLPINLPAKNGSTVVDCFFQPSGESDFSSVGDAHQHIIDQVVEINETVMGHYLDDGESGLSGQELHDAFEQCLREGHLVPICFTSGRTGAGVREFLALAAKLMPNPKEGNPPQFVKGSGANALYVIATHILPNVVTPIIVACTLTVGRVILFGSVLSFLGFGIVPPTPSWGNMLNNAQELILVAPSHAIYPGLLIFTAVIAVNFIGDGLQNAFDPKATD